MLKELEIINFKPYDSQKFVFSKGLNVFVPHDEEDPNGIGKTAVFAAVEMLATNRPLSASVFHDGANVKDPLIIRALFFDGLRVSLTKFFSLKKDGTRKVKSTIWQINDEKPFKGAKVPVEVQKALGLSDINFHHSKDLFVIAEQPTSILKKINETMATGEIEQTQRTLKKKKQRIKNDIRVYEKEIKKYKDEVASLSWVDKIEGRIKNLEGLKKKRLTLRREIEIAKESVQQIVRSDKYIKKYEEVYDKMKGHVETLHSLVKKSEILLTAQKTASFFLVSSAKVLSLKEAIAKQQQKYFRVLKSSGECPVCFSEVTDQNKKQIQKGVKKWIL